MADCFSDTFLGQLEQLHSRRAGVDVAGDWPHRQQALMASYRSDYPCASPFYGYLKVVRSCNSRCIYCDHWKLQAGHDPSTAELQTVIESLYDLGVRHINLTGGEPLLRPDLPDLVDFAHQQDMVVCLLTNGLLLPRMADALLEAQIDAIIISIDSVVPGEFLHTRGVPFHLVEKGLYPLVEMKNKHPEMFVSITSVITNVNLFSVVTLIEYANQYDVGVQFSPYHHFDQGQPDDLTPQDISSVEKIICQLLRMKSLGHKLLDSPQFLKHFPRFFEHRCVPKGFKCMAGYVAVFADVDLNVRPCWMIKPVGNLRQERLEDIWYSARFQEARRRIKALQCPKCWLLCTAEPSLYVQED
jgi:MoaA/NifB/PqqE/SkfB family radical SAM enzyme